MIAQLETQTEHPPSPSSRTGGIRTAAVAVTVAIFAAACGGGTEEPDLSADVGGEEASELSFDAGDDATTTTFGPDETDTSIITAPPEEDSTTQTTVGSGLGPVSTIAVGSGGDPDGIYIGKLGNLDPTEPQVAGVAVPPKAEPNMFPLTGEIGTVPDRPAAVVKIDNGSAAAPHQGLNAADIVIEEEVEGGVTRFAAIFHSTASIVGPVRSGRTTDLALISGLGTPLLMYSGANQITEGILRSQPSIQNRSYDSAAGGYWRDGSRRAPSNLFSDTGPHWASATGGPPPAQFYYRSLNEPAVGQTVNEFTVSYPASSARWLWDGERWLRWQRGVEHLLVSGDQVDAANVVVIEAERVATGMVDSSGGAVPEFYFVGTGAATVYTDGVRIDGIWTRPTLNSVATITTESGEPIGLTPGRTWMQLVDAGTGHTN